MGSTFLSLHYHIVFSTKERRPFIKPAWRTHLHEYLGGTIRGWGGVPKMVGGVEDHVHLLVGLRATHCLANFMQELKKASSVWAAEKHEQTFSWQEGCAAFTVSWTHIEMVRQYIARQEEHHRQTDYVAELEQLLKKDSVKYEEKYLL
ncbi:MAG TPA: IS200/IS605 family transposase [Verrucomicrobiae bacterium]|nr:IS200/IS605 family transposase [Verrucomicrobiae bacterium]